MKSNLEQSHDQHVHNLEKKMPDVIKSQHAFVLALEIWSLN